MVTFFNDRSIVGHCGGDEFFIFLPRYTVKEASVQLLEFMDIIQQFPYNDTFVTFQISIGYDEYYADGSDISWLFSNADMALYEAKLRGKHKCMRFSSECDTQKRSQLGFELKDISENLPGAFLICIADMKK